MLLSKQTYERNTREDPLMIDNPYNLPIGYFDFHRKQVYNYQFNRWHSLGFAGYEDIKQAGKRIQKFTDWKSVLLDLAKHAENEQRLKNACIYYRGAEFYINQDDPDKLKSYKSFINLFNTYFKEDAIKRIKIPYQQSSLPGLILETTHNEKKGTIVMHGGFDSCIEEFYYMMKLLADQGYDIVAFDGPGQGGARRLYNLGWDDHWEKPIKVVLDYLSLDQVILYGISMGGYLCLRAAAFEPRIRYVVSSGGAVDYWKIPGFLSRNLFKFFLHFPNFMNKQLRKKMKKDAHHRWFAENAMYITKINNPFRASIKILDMNRKNLHAHKITQDVLFLSSSQDHFIPKKMHKINMHALPNAQSITGKLFTKETHAQNHCQIGNIPLACHIVCNWLERYNKN